MASRIYQLHTCSRAGVAPQAGHVLDVSSQGNHGEDCDCGEDHGSSEGEDPQTANTVPVVKVPVVVCSYCNVVASRPSSP